jgi:hypothetical protein
VKQHGSTRNASNLGNQFLMINMLQCISVTSCSRLATCFLS